MLSRHDVFAPRVAEPLAFQYTAALAPLSMAFAAESGALSGVRGRREAQAAPALPSLSSARVPDGFVVPAGTVRTPGRGAKPLKSVRSFGTGPYQGYGVACAVRIRAWHRPRHQRGQVHDQQGSLEPPVLRVHAGNRAAGARAAGIEGGSFGAELRGGQAARRASGLALEQMQRHQEQRHGREREVECVDTAETREHDGGDARA